MHRIRMHVGRSCTTVLTQYAIAVAHLFCTYVRGHPSPRVKNQQSSILHNYYYLLGFGNQFVSEYYTRPQQILCEQSPPQKISNNNVKIHHYFNSVILGQKCLTQIISW